MHIKNATKLNWRRQFTILVLFLVYVNDIRASSVASSTLAPQKSHPRHANGLQSTPRLLKQQPKDDLKLTDEKPADKIKPAATFKSFYVDQDFLTSTFDEMDNHQRHYTPKEIILEREYKHGPHNMKNKYKKSDTERIHIKLDQLLSKLDSMQRELRREKNNYLEQKLITKDQKHVFSPVVISLNSETSTKTMDEADLKPNYYNNNVPEEEPGSLEEQNEPRTRLLWKRHQIVDFTDS